MSEEQPSRWRRWFGALKKKKNEQGELPSSDAERAPLAERLSSVFSREKTGRFVERVQRVDWGKVVDWGHSAVQRRGAALYGKLLTVALCAWLLADVSSLLIEGFIPEPPVARVSTGRFENAGSGYNPDDYAVIWTRNLFNSKGLLPGEEDTGMQDQGGTPVRTSLPFNLIGTLVLRDELRSLATIEDKSASQVYPVRVDDEIPSKARIIKVEADRVIFLNTASGRREFIDIPADPAAQKPISVMRAAPALKGGKVEQVRENAFQVSRTAVDAALADFNQVLTQARAVPNFENGVPNGYKLFQIVPGSIYAQLGLQNGDTIVGLNGEGINDPAKAFELLGQLKSGASHMELSIKRNGQTKNMTYDIK